MGMSYPKHPGVYAIVHPESGRLYIGSSVNIYSRWRSHKSDLKNRRHYCVYLQRAWDKHGEEAFEWRVLESCLKEKLILIAREQHWLDRYKGQLFNSINTANPAESRCPTAEERQAMSERMKGNKNGYGTHYHGCLTELDVIEIMHRYATGESSKSIAAHFGVTRTNINRITSRKIWWRVQIPPEVEAKCKEMNASHGTAEPLALPIPARPTQAPAQPMPKRKNRPRHESKPRPPRVPVNCSHCGVEMLIRPHRLRDHKDHYCSKDCRRHGLSKRVREEMSNPERRERLRQINLGKRHSEETRQKMSESQRRRAQGDNPEDQPVTPNT